MHPRLIISLLVAGTLAYACGPRSRSEAPSASLSASLASAQLVHASTIAQQGQGQHPNLPRARRHDSTIATKDDARLDTHFEVRVANDIVHFALNVTNTGGKHVELTFPSGQSYDIVVVDSVGREIWRWGNGRMFTQAVRNKQLAKGESMTVEEKWSSTKHTGHYTAIALLNSTNYPVEQKVDFVLP
jgi:hypothetical protein